MSRTQIVSTGGSVEISQTVYATNISMTYQPWSLDDSTANFETAVHYVHDGVPQRAKVPGQASIKVDGVEVQVPSLLPVRYGDVKGKVYQVPDGQGGYIPVTGAFVLGALQVLFNTEFEEDQAARLAEVG